MVGDSVFLADVTVDVEVTVFVVVVTDVIFVTGDTTGERSATRSM